MKQVENYRIFVCLCPSLRGVVLNQINSFDKWTFMKEQCSSTEFTHIEEPVMFSGSNETSISNSNLQQAIEDDEASIYFGECWRNTLVKYSIFHFVSLISLARRYTKVSQKGGCK